LRAVPCAERRLSMFPCPEESWTMECQCPTKEQDGTRIYATETECPMAVSTSPLTKHPHHNTTALYPSHTNLNPDEEEADPTADPTGTMPEPGS